MKAIIWTAYGGPEVLQLGEVEKPSPKDNEVLVRIHASTVTAGDCEMRTLKMPLGLGLPIRIYAGLRKPTRITILGQELAGEIESVGKGVTRFRAGDRVYGTPGFGMGGYAEYKCLAEDTDVGVLAKMPSNLSFDEAAAVPVGGLEALHFLGQAQIRAGQSVLINGAGGSIGTIGVQLAKHDGAEVTAVDSAGKHEMLRSIGADHVIDYRQEDFTQAGRTYDAILDVIGRASFSGCMRSLADGGAYLLANPSYSRMLRGRWMSATSSKRVIIGGTQYRTQDLDHLSRLIEAGVLKPVIDRRFPLEQTAEAHRYVEAGGKQGNVVITVAHGDPQAQG